MRRLNIGIFMSGEGSTTKMIMESIKNNLIQVDVSFIAVNRERQEGDLDNYTYYPYSFKQDDREIYLRNLRVNLNRYKCDYYLFLGWNMIVNSAFITTSPPIINLHPALPNTFIGSNCITINKTFEFLIFTFNNFC